MSTIGTEISKTPSEAIGKAVESLIQGIDRKKWERRWYDNRFFDDGMHFRYISRKTGRIIDYAGKQNITTERAIPKASKQIRGIANLMQSAELSPVVYPEFIEQSNYTTPQDYMKALDEAKRRAKRTGNWLTNIWTDYDEGLAIKFIDMMLNAAKDGISYIQVYSPPGKQKLCFDVFDAFDLNIYGEYKELERLPFVDKGVPMRISEAKNHPLFKDVNFDKLIIDNKYANSEIKDAYMRARFGLRTGDGQEPSLIIHETHFKEILNEDNWQNAVKLGGDTGALEGKSKGDVVMRHAFTSGGVTLSDEYIYGDSYPYVDFRYEPGPLYQTPLIERFIPQNKSLDIIMTRLESWINGMVIGAYLMRKGENMQISNFPGGQKLVYEGAPPVQMKPSSVGDTPFRVLEILEHLISEQGTNSAVNNLPTGVKSGVAIESVKATEYANLKISTIMLKNSIQRISAKAIEVVDQRFVKPETVYNMDNGNPDYFSIVGNRGYQKALEVGKKLSPSVVPIKTGTKLRIEIEPGFGLTIQGKREAVQQVIDYMIKLADLGYMTKPAVKIIVQKFLDTFGYGSTQELMDAMEQDQPMSEDDIMKMKIALLEGLKEAGQIGPEQEQRLVNSSALGAAQALKDTGMLDKNKQQPMAPKPPNVSINFSDLPPEGKAQAAREAGLDLTPGMFINDAKFKMQSEAALKQVAPPMQKSVAKKT